MQNLLKLALSLSLITFGYTAQAQPSMNYQATVVGDCSQLKNCPLIRGDTLVTSKNSRSGLPLQNGMLILGFNTEVKILNLNNQLKEFNLIKGSLSLNILKNEPRHAYKINAGKLLKIFIKEAGYYRIEVSANQRETIVRVTKGRAALRIGNIIRVIKQGQSATIQETNTNQPLYTNVKIPLYDNDYNFAMNFTHNYYTLYPVNAPSIRLIPRPIANGPAVVIYYARPITFYEQPTTFYQEPIIIREPRYRNIQPTISVDVNLNKIFGNANPRTQRDSRTTTAPTNSKPITETTSIVTPETIPDSTFEERNLNTNPNRAVSGTTTDLTPGATSGSTPESSIKVIDNPSEQILSTPETQPQINRQPGVRTDPIISPETRPQPTRNEGIRVDPIINTDAQTSKEIIPDAEPRKRGFIENQNENQNNN